MVAHSNTKLVLECGHHFYAVLQVCAREFGVKNVEVLCGACGRWVKCREIDKDQMRLDYGSETTSVNVGKPQP